MIARVQFSTAAVLLSFGLLWAPGHVQAEPLIDSTRQPIIYGEDDRVDVYASDSAQLRQIAERSTVALIPSSNLQRTGAGFAPIDRLLGQLLLCPFLPSASCRLCEDEPFVEQPAVADCSGVLIDDDLVLTAGHCFEDDDSCARYTYVFGYLFEGPGQLASIEADDVYGCRRIVRRELSDNPQEPHKDYTIIQLDRPVSGRQQPVELRSEPMTVGERISAVGNPVGIPTKIDKGGIVREASSSRFFTTTTDTFVGNSGSGLYDSEGRLAGHLVLGGQDFVEDEARGCLRNAVVADGETPPLFEHGVYPRVWQKGLCSAGWPSERLCGVEAARKSGCGDGLCAGLETDVSCGADCRVALCSGLDCMGQPGDLPQLKKKGCSVAFGQARGLGGALPWLVALLLYAVRRAYAAPARRRRARTQPLL